jgi:hypothetical protein
MSRQSVHLDEVDDSGRRRGRRRGPPIMSGKVDLEEARSQELDRTDRKRSGRSWGGWLEGNAPHHRLAGYLVDHPDLDGVGRQIADDCDHRIGAPLRRQLFEAGARVTGCARAARTVHDLGLESSRRELTLEAHQRFDHHRRSVDWPNDQHAGCPRGRRHEQAGRRDSREHESAHARRLRERARTPAPAPRTCHWGNAGDTPRRSGAPETLQPACSSTSSCVPGPPRRTCPSVPA